MSYVEKNLQQNETIVKTIEKNIFPLIGKWILGVLFCWLLFIPLIKAIAATISFSNEELIVTNKRVMGVKGVFNTQSLDAPLNKIQNISITQNLCGKIFNFSTIIINTNVGCFYFEYVKSSIEFKNCTLEQIEKYEKE